MTSVEFFRDLKARCTGQLMVQLSRIRAKELGLTAAGFLRDLKAL